MYKEHPLFNPPPDDAVLWRYMDFTKFVSLLDKSALFFARADKLGDPFEGALSKINVALWPVLYTQIPKESFQKFAESRKKWREYTLISCWHERPYESEAMWRLYSRETDGIAIKTKFGSFKKSLISSEDIYIGKVSYVDYESTFIPEGNTFGPYLYKRQSFDHEREVRAIVQIFSQDICDIGKYYEVDLSLLIQEVIVSPFAPAWLLELIHSVATRYNLETPIVKSNLGDNPMWG